MVCCSVCDLQQLCRLAWCMLCCWALQQRQGRGVLAVAAAGDYAMAAGLVARMEAAVPVQICTAARPSADDDVAGCPARHQQLAQPHGCSGLLLLLLQQMSCPPASPRNPVSITLLSPMQLTRSVAHLVASKHPHHQLLLLLCGVPVQQRQLGRSAGTREVLAGLPAAVVQAPQVWGDWVCCPPRSYQQVPQQVAAAAVGAADGGGAMAAAAARAAAPCCLLHTWHHRCCCCHLPLASSIPIHPHLDLTTTQPLAHRPPMPWVLKVTSSMPGGC